jgi:thiol-disulfide isomerase/thioredoxin
MALRIFFSSHGIAVVGNAILVAAVCVTAGGCGPRTGSESSPPAYEVAANDEPATAVTPSEPEIAAAPHDAGEGELAPAEPPPDQAAQAPERNSDPPAEDALVDDGNPFPRRIPAPEFPADMEWLNTGGPLRLADLRGKLVLFDFWTYCCINCIHILPELKKLEKKYPNELVVIGVHSAKFETEQEAQNIKKRFCGTRSSIPVVNDNEHAIWNSYGVRSWPTILLIDPEGYAVYGRSGEFKAEQLEPILKEAIAWYDQKGAAQTHADPLRAPGAPGGGYAAPLPRQGAGR